MKITIELEIEGEDPGAAAAVIDRVLEAGTIQDAIIEAAEDLGACDFEITDASCVIPEEE